MSEDPLEKHRYLIAVAERGELESHAHMIGRQCIADLAAALRAERARVAELETRLAESETQRMTDYDDTLLGREMREKESRGIA